LWRALCDWSALLVDCSIFFFFFQAEDGIRDRNVTGVQTCALPIFITVVFNNAKDIEYTIQSVLNQSYEHVEYIIVDGLSTDGTLDILNKYRAQIDILISEKDKGIYDAMNKGLEQATGGYVLFLNSGDAFYDKNTLSAIFTDSEGADIYYGETKLIDENRKIIGDRRHKTPEKFTWKSFRYGMNICHQAIFIKRAIAPKYD